MTAPTLRYYQQPIYEEIPHRLKLGPVLVQAPARSGKSKIISATVLRIIKAGKIPIVLTHRDKIQKQLIEHCDGVAITAKTDHVFIKSGHCYVAMQQTLIKRPFILGQLKLHGSNIVLLVDEAHRGDFNKMFEELPNALRIGFTATPAWKWAKFLPTYYTSLIHGPQIRELMATGNITPIDYYEMQEDLSALQKGNNGEFTEQSNQFVFDQAKLYNGLFEQLPKFTYNKCIIFCASKKSADLLTQQMKEHGYNVTTFYSGIDKAELCRFTDLGQVNHLVTVSQLAEGFDHSPIDMNVLWRATSSLPLFLQMGARGATPHEGKSKTTVLDFGGNNTRFGGRNNIQALTMDRDWNALWQPPEKPPVLKSGVASVKVCPACEFMLSSLARSCSNCGYIYPESEVILKEGELQQIRNEEAVIIEQTEQLNGRRISTLTATELALYAKKKDKKAFCMRVARSQELEKPGFVTDYGKAMNYSGHWANRILKDQAEIRNYDPGYTIPYSDILVR